MICVLVAYRDRPDQLQTFGDHMDNYLPEEVDVRVIEQEEGRLFNRGKLFNVGFDLFEDDYHTFVFHDVDMVPVDAKYRRVQRPTHLCGSASQFDNRGGRPYDSYFGGVTAFDKDSFRTVNGFSNQYWGWGAEDDDIRIRCRCEGLDIEWRDYRFRSLDQGSIALGENQHEKLDYNRKRLRQFDVDSGYDHTQDGLIDLEYEVLGEQENSLYTKITVSI